MSGYTHTPAALILRHDVISTIRGSSRRMTDHLFTTVFAILLIIPFMAAITGIMIFIFTEDTIFSDLVTPGDFFLTVYILVSGRALSTTVRHVYKNPTTELLRITPISAAYIYRGKIQSVMVLNLLTFSIFFAGFLSFFLLMYQDPISASLLAYYILYLYLIAIFSTLSGFSIPLLYFLQGNLRLRTLAFVAPIIFGGGIILSFSDLGGALSLTGSSLLFPMLLLFFTILLYLIVRGMDWYFNEAIHTYTPYSAFEREQTPRLVELIRYLCRKGPVSCEGSSHIKIMASKELLGSLRDSYFMIYAAMTAILTVMGVMMVLSIPQDFLDSDWGWLVFPVAISFFLYIEGSFMVTLGSISLIGKEGRRLWILRSLPVSGSDVLTGKAISVIIPSLVGGYAMMIPLLYLTQLPAGQNMVFLVLTSCIIFSFSGIGIMAGAKYPNFSEGSKGSPDIVFQMFILFICLIFLGFIIIPPMTFYYNYGWLVGTGIAFVVLAFSYAVFVHGVRLGERIFDRLSAEEYEA